jgi:hypothetical protein
VTALFQAYSDRRPAAQRDLILHAEAAEQAAAARGALLTTLHQGEVDAAALRHSCCTLPDTPPPAIKSKRVILLQDQHDCVRVSVPTVECLVCARKWEVLACQSCSAGEVVHARHVAAVQPPAQARRPQR